jgi:uroporphyrinogen decarboxylase
MGISAINSQLWCMGLEKAEPYAGKITFWGEISRQTTLPNGTPDEIRAAAAMMKERLWKNGGLIGQSEIGRDVPMQNIDALLTCWNSAG